LPIFVKDGDMCKSGIFDTKTATSLKRSGLEPKLLESVYRNSCKAYRLVTNLVTYSVTSSLYVVKVMFSVLASELITQEQIAVGASNLVEVLIM